MISDLIGTAKEIAIAHVLRPEIICAIVEQESSWNTFALRPESESGFAAKYGPAYHDIVKKTANKADDVWIHFEDIFYTSYGLMQTMYPVVIEMVPDIAADMRFPSELCDPRIGLTAGCRIFAKKLAQVNGAIDLGLLHWNGGGDKDYPAKVLARVNKYL